MSIGTVVVVPGYGGSELLTCGWFGCRPIWLAYQRFVTSWQRLVLPGDGSIKPGGPLRAYYGPLIDRLGRYGWRVVAPVLDWRGPGIDDAGRVLNAVRTEYVRGGEPVHLVGHSRGGLTMRRVLGMLGSAGQAHYVGRCVALGTPHRGSLAAAALLGGWNSTKVLLYNLLSAVPFQTLIGGQPAGALNAMIASWPATYELLPAPGHNWLSQDQYARLYSGDAYCGSPFQQQLCDNARRAWAEVPELPSGAQWLDVQGTGQATPSGLRDGCLSDPASYSWFTDGDGTVARGSLLDWTAPRYELRQTHDRLPQDGRAIDAAHTFLAVGEVLPSPIS
jgi:hypothetical protein